MIQGGLLEQKEYYKSKHLLDIRVCNLTNDLLNYSFKELTDEILDIEKNINFYGFDQPTRVTLRNLLENIEKKNV